LVYKESGNKSRRKRQRKAQKRIKEGIANKP